MRIKNKFIFIMIFVILFSINQTVLTFGTADTQKELNNVKDRISDVKNLLNIGQKKEKSLSDQIKEIDKKIAQIENEISNLEKEINDTQNQIDKKIEEIKEKEEEIRINNDTMNNRLRVMYKNGNTGLIEILLGSSNFLEFMNNLDMVSKIIKQDVNLLKSLEKKHKELNENKKILEEIKRNLYNKKQDIQKKQKDLQVNRGEADRLKKEVEKDNVTLEAQIDELNKYAADLSEQIRKVQSSEAYVGGVFLWPAPGFTRITSPYGYRIHPILKTKKLHTGIDIGIPSNNNVVAANDGTVIHSNWLNGYGKTIMIDHGGEIVTLYAHNNDLLVQVGDKVKRGQVISKSGNTGMSTGPHLHFEVRNNGNYVDPMLYLK